MEETKLVELRNDIDELRNYINSFDIVQICSELKRICLKDNGPYIIQTLFVGLANQSSRYKVLEQLLTIIESQVLCTQSADKLMVVLAPEMETFSTPHQLLLTELCVESFHKSRKSDSYPFWKELLPTLLSIINEKDSIEHSGSKMSGAEYKSQIVTSLCVSQWPLHVVPVLASMFIEVPLTDEEHLKVVNKLCSYIGAESDMTANEIPPLTYQLLQLTKFQHSIIVFITLQQYFTEKLYLQNMNSDSRNLKDIQSVEGTVVYHIYSAASNFSPQSVKEFLKILKEIINAPEFTLEPFFVTTLLNVSAISNSLQEEVMLLLKSVVMRCVLEQEKISSSMWIESVSPVHTVKVEDLFDKIINNSRREQNKLMKGLVNFGFALLNVTHARGKETLSSRLWILGTDIIVKLVKKYSCVTNTVLQTLCNYISPEHKSSQYTDCLGQIAKFSPLNMLDCPSALSQLVEVSTQLPGDVGQRVVAAIVPLTKLSPSLRDNLIMVLRKALFPVDIKSRQTAVFGFLQLLRDLRVNNLTALSQSINQNYSGLSQFWSQSYSSKVPPHSNEGLCLEMLSVLREVFNHQADIKISLYKGIYDAVCCNIELSSHVVNSLQTHFLQFYKPGDVIPPLDFDKVATVQGAAGVLQEPLSHLVFTLGLVIAKADEDENGRDMAKLQNMFDLLCDRMIHCEVANFNLDADDGCPILENLPESQCKYETLCQILSVYEALMGYTLCSWTKESSQKSQIFLDLFKAYSRLSDYAKGLKKIDKKKIDDIGKQQKDKRSDKSKSSFKFPPPIWNIKTLTRLMTILNNESVSWASDQSTFNVKGKRDIHRYCMQTTLTMLRQLLTESHTSLFTQHSFLAYLFQIGRSLYQRCISRLSEYNEFDHVAATTSLDCFKELLSIILTHFKSKLTNFISEIADLNVENGIRMQLQGVLDLLVDQLDERMKDEEEDDSRDNEVLSKKLTVLLIANITTLVPHLPRGGTHLQQILDKVKKMCKVRKTENPHVAKGLLSLLLTLNVGCKQSSSLMLDVAFCLCRSMKLIDEEMEVEEHTIYSIINNRTANVCLITLCETLHQVVNEVEWIVARFRAELTTLSFPKKALSLEERREALKERESSLCHHVNFSVKVLSVLCTIAVPTGVYSDAVLKEIANTYNKLTLLTKYFITKVGKYHQNFQTTRFEKTVRLVDSELSKNMYCFTDHVISDGAGSLDDSNPKNKINPTVLKNRVMKETKNIPKVVYEKEQFHKFIMQLSNKSKVDLVGRTKHAMARDYRLYTKQVKDILDKENIQIEDGSGDETETTNIESSSTSYPPTKKSKLQ